MKSVAIFVDVTELYDIVDFAFKKKVDYRKYYEKCSEFGTPYRAFAYGTYMDIKLTKDFLNCIESYGYEPKYIQVPRPPDILPLKKKITSFLKECKTGDIDEDSFINHILSAVYKRQTINLSMNITMDIVRLIDRVDTIILGSSNPVYAPTLDWVRERGVKAITFSCRVPYELRMSSDQWIEIDETHLENKNGASVTV